MFQPVALWNIYMSRMSGGVFVVAGEAWLSYNYKIHIAT